MNCPTCESTNISTKDGSDGTFHCYNCGEQFNDAGQSTQKYPSASHIIVKNTVALRQAFPKQVFVTNILLNQGRTAELLDEAGIEYYFATKKFGDYHRTEPTNRNAK